MKVRISLAVGVVALAGGLVLAACSSSEDHSGMTTESTNAVEGSTATTAAIAADAPYNATDVGFAQGMIPHHGQAIEMAEMALDRSDDADVLRLAAAIKAAQQPEIDQLSGWLEDWGQTVPDADIGADHDMSDTGGMMMSGMMSAADMERLDAAAGTNFDRMWLEMMIQHHEGAIDMADDELADGKFADAKVMAQNIVTSQQAEITEMEGLISEMPS
jgi:uncharacterized protein (DUF305 family)